MPNRLRGEVGDRLRLLAGVEVLLVGEFNVIRAVQETGDRSQGLGEYEV